MLRLLYSALFFTLFTTLSYAQNCQNAIMGGSISGNQSICAGAIPNTILNTAFPTGGTGTFEYLWIYWDVEPASAPDDFKIIQNSNTKDLQATALTHTTWFRRCARRAGCTDYVAETNIVKVQVTPAILTAVCQDITVALDAAGQAEITATQIDNGSSYTCGTSLDFQLSQTTFTSTGVFPVTLSAIGKNGQTETCTAQVRVTPPPCDNAINGGFISGPIEICTGETAGAITSIEAADGGSGQLEYRWVSSTVDPATNATAFTVLQGETGETLTIGALTQTTWYRREARRANCTDFTGLSNIKKIKVNTTAAVNIQNTANCTVKVYEVAANGSETLLNDLAATATLNLNLAIGTTVRIRTATGQLQKEAVITDCNAVLLTNDNCGISSDPIPVPTGCDGEGGETYTLEIKFDNYPGETSWYINDASGQTIASGGPYTTAAKGSTISKEICVPVGCHKLTFKDAYGDGIYGAYGYGYYKLKNTGGQVVASGGSFRYSETTSFCMGGPVTPVCDNFTNGGQIGKDCQNGELVLTDLQSPNGGSGDMEIVWMQSIQGCSFSTMTEISRGEDLTITMDAVTVPTYFVRCSRRAGCTTLNDFKESNCLVVYPSECGVQSTCSNKTVLLVVGSTNLCYGDAWVKTRLEQLGLTVQVITDSQASSSSANGKALIVVSSSTLSSNVGTKFTNSTVPLITWESYLFGYLKMTGNTAGQDFGSMTTSCLTINAPGHPLADGMEGTFSIYSSNKTARCGQPTSSAIKVASFCNASNEWAVFAYEKNAAMKGGFAAPARRVGLFLDDNTPQCLYSKGRRMFDASVRWAMDCTDLPNLGVAVKSENLSFNVAETNREVTVLWTNNTGEANDKFEVQRSQDGETFETIETVNGSGPIGDILYFRIKDAQPLKGESFYRLKWVLNTGDFTYSEIKSVHILDIKGFSVYPNPASDHFNIDLSTWAGETATIELVDMNGKTHATFTTEASYAPSRIDLPNLTPGQYFVRIQTAKYRPEVRKIQVVDRF